MKLVILAGGYGTRISEETGIRPKPMVEIGDKPIIWHIMKIYSNYDVNDFVLCLGYKGYAIKEFFANYALKMSDVTYDFRKNRKEFHQDNTEPWKVTLVETGLDTMTGGRIKRIRPYIGNETFCLTYGDGLSDVNIQQLIRFHKSQGSLATLTAVQPPGRFGVFKLDQNEYWISSFKEKPEGDGAWVNGGFFVLEPEVFDFIESDATVWEKEPMERLAREGKLAAYRHQGFWQPMDTLRDKNYLEKLWQSGQAPWKVWKS